MVTFANWAEPGSLRKRWSFHLRMSTKRILFYLQPNSNRFRTRSGAVHEERAEWTFSWHGVCSKMWNPPRMEVETLWVSTWKKDISFGNKFDWVEGVRATFWDLHWMQHVWLHRSNIDISTWGFVNLRSVLEEQTQKKFRKLSRAWMESIYGAGLNI